MKFKYKIRRISWKKYPKIDTLNAIKKNLEALNISLSPILIEGIKSEIKRYQEITIENINPYPTEILEATRKNKKGKFVKGIIFLFENPYRYVEIVDENGNIYSVDDLPEAKIIDRLGLWINKNDYFDVQLVLIDSYTFAEIKSIPIKEIRIKSFYNLIKNSIQEWICFQKRILRKY